MGCEANDSTPSQNRAPSYKYLALVLLVTLIRFNMQLRLATVDGRMKLVEQSGQNLSAWPAPPNIHAPHFPPEILLRIFQHFNDNAAFRPREIDPYRRDDGERLPNLVRLILVCRTWRSLVEPILYRRLLWAYSIKNGDKTRKKLQRTLLERPDLCKYVQHLRIGFLYNSRRLQDYEMLQDDVRAIWRILQCMQPKTLFLDGSTVEDLNPQLENSLREIEFEEIETFNIRHEFVITYLQEHRSSKLKHLKIRYYGRYWIEERMQRWQTSRSTYNNFPQYRTRLDILEAHGSQGTAQNFEVICRSIVGVRILRLKYMMHSQGSRTWTRASIQNMLNTQKESLEELELACYFSTPTQLPNLMEMPRLKILKVSSKNLFKDAAQVAARNLQRVEDLTIDTDGCDQQCDYTGKFDAQDAEWVYKFAEASTVKRIHIIFEWDPYEAERYRQWPSSPLKTLKPRLAALSVDLTWHGEPLTEEEWEAKVRKRMAEEAGEESDYDDEDSSEEEEDTMSEPVDELERELEKLCRLPQTKPDGQGSIERFLRQTVPQT